MDREIWTLVVAAIVILSMCMWSMLPEKGSPDVDAPEADDDVLVVRGTHPDRAEAGRVVGVDQISRRQRLKLVRQR